MQWLSQNWIWVLVFVAFIAMHMFGHGGHGGCGGGHRHGKQNAEPTDEKTATHQH